MAWALKEADVVVKEFGAEFGAAFMPECCHVIAGDRLPA
jgi:hypothetical protein